ncbi:hypothetical protein C3731_15865 [Brucella oryzae]|uniref:YfdX family protein n=2 Tax=Brucella oryzae TaxID=335286 RepID=A0A2S7IX83_9HYPH|nr:YfdX family protein [Brucella oryzae]PQA72619.1 hypothetical protein C3731_15865 [Brucella oryzae]
MFLAKMLVSSSLIAASLTVPSFAETAAKPAQADTTSPASSPTKSSSSSAQLAAINKLDAISKDALNAVRGINFSRLAIFQGTPDEAKTILKKVKDDLDKAQKSTPALIDKLKAAGATTDEITAVQSGTLPIDMQVGVVDDYTLTPEKTEHIKKANEHLKNGRKNEAIEELKLADINIVVTETSANLPAIGKYVDQALSQLDDGKYYEANMTLIKAQSMVTINSSMAPDIKPGTPAQPAKAATKTK